jgi:hypothetical protein
MRKLLTLLFLFACLNGFSQTFELGTGVGLYRLKGIYTDRFQYPYLVNQLNTAITFMGSGNIPLKQIREELYIGINPNVGVGYSYYGGMLALDVPAYATLKYGLGSHKNSNKSFGFGIGAGGQFSGFTMNVNAGGVNTPFSKAYLVPSVMAQVVFEVPNNYRVYQIRADITPVPAEKTKGNFIGNINQYTIMIMTAF